MAKYSTNLNSKHNRAKDELKNAYGELLVSYNVRHTDGMEFEFELSRELTDEEWSKMPSSLIIYKHENGVFEGEFKPHI